MKKCKIEVIKITFDEEFAEKYGVACACPVHKVGEFFYERETGRRITDEYQTRG